MVPHASAQQADHPRVLVAPPPSPAFAKNASGKVRGALAATIFKLPPVNRRDSSVLRSPSSVSVPRNVGDAAKIGSMSETT